MTYFNFEEGDKVYYPTATNEILRVYSDFLVRYLDINDESTNSTIEDGGRFYNFHHNPSFFPATQEWYDKLVTIYPNLEKPLAKKDPKEIIQEMLDDGWVGVPCWVSGNYKNPDKNSRIEVILEVRDDIYCPFRADITSWTYVTPFDSKTGKTIIDYVDGGIVLED